MTPAIVPMRGAADAVTERIRAVRAAGDIPLVGDERWPEAQWASVRGLARAAEPPSGTAWATLTSGSSGAPRIVLRTAESWRDSFGAVAALLSSGPATAGLGPRPDAGSGAEPGAVVLPAPMASSLTLFSVAHAMDGGGPRPVSPATEPDAARAATAFHGTPGALESLLASGAIPNVRTALVGGSHVDERVRALAESSGIRLIAYYGAAELSFVAIDDGDGLRAFPGVELDVRRGELWVRSPFVALGYAGGGGPLRRDGDWASVGDLAEIIDGRLRLRGRSDGAIITASATVIPEEVEASLRQIPGVADAVVFGAPAGNVGALVAAMIEFHPEAAPAEAAALRAAAAELLAPAHRPRLWFAGELPRGASGKPARAEIARRALAGEVPRVA